MNTFAPPIALRAFEAVCALKRAGSLEELDAIARPLFMDLGFQSFAAARFYAADGASSPALLYGYTGEWGARYFASGYGRMSSIAREMLKRRTPYSWSDIYGHRHLDPSTQLILNEAREFGFKDGLYAPIRDSDGNYAAVALCGTADLSDPFIRTVSEVLAGYYASEGNRLTKRPVSRASLSPRQRECLTWVRQGKSSADIGEILGLSVPTVDGHIAEACRKLGVRTRVQAAVEACLAGLLEG